MKTEVIGHSGFLRRGSRLLEQLRWVSQPGRGQTDANQQCKLRGRKRLDRRVLALSVVLVPPVQSPPFSPSLHLTPNRKDPLPLAARNPVVIGLVKSSQGWEIDIQCSDSPCLTPGPNMSIRERLHSDAQVQVRSLSLPSSQFSRHGSVSW